MNDNSELMPSVTIPLAALRDVLIDVRYARKQADRANVDAVNHIARVLDALTRCDDALKRVEAEIDGWLRLAGDEQPEAGQ